MEQIANLIDTRVSSAIAAIPSATSVVFPTPGPTLEEVSNLIDTRVSSYIAEMPTATPFVLPTPSVTLDEVRSLVDGAIATAVSMALTAVPTPILRPSLSSGVEVTLVDEVSLRVEPGQPLAGRDVSFYLTGLDPWQMVDVEFVDPLGVPTEWVLPSEGRFISTNGRPVTRASLFADEDGTLTWTRIGTKDREGIWTVVVTLEGEPFQVVYPVTQVILPALESIELGAELRWYRGSAADTYISAGVPFSLVLDIQSYLLWVMEMMDSDMGLQSAQIPDLYLASSEEVLTKIGEALGIGPRFESGFYTSSIEGSGIYVRTDALLTEILRTIVHEFVHLALDEMDGAVSVPAWLNEGLASYTEFELGLQGVRPNATRRHLYRSVLTVKKAAKVGELLPLADIEDQRVWNSQRDPSRVQLQYAQSQMAVRYLVELSGREVVATIVGLLAEGREFPQAFKEATGLTYTEFENGFPYWVGQWTDPIREAVQYYVTVLSDIMDEEEEIYGRRNLGLVLRDAETLKAQIDTITPPDVVEAIHVDATRFLSGLVKWLGLELHFTRTQHETDRLAANGILAELRALKTSVLQGIIDMRFDYQID